MRSIKKDTFTILKYTTKGAAIGYVPAAILFGTTCHHGL